MPDNKVESLNRVVVLTYKWVGFALLGLIVVALVGYISLQAFFVVSRSWVLPSIVYPSDDKVVGLKAKVAEYDTAKDRLEAERRQLVAQRDDAVRIGAAQREFEGRLSMALGRERSERRREVRTLDALTRVFDQTRGQCAGSRTEYTKMVEFRAAQHLEAQLLDRETFLGEQARVAELALSELALSRQESEHRIRLRAARREASALKTLSLGEGGELTLEALKWAQELAASRLEASRAGSVQSGLEQTLTELAGAIERYESLAGSLRSSPYLATEQEGLPVVFVPYNNLSAAEPGAPLYACSAWLLWCRKVGKLGERIEGEVPQKHPVRNRLLRGEMFQVQLEEPAAAREELLHLGRAPFWL